MKFPTTEANVDVVACVRGMAYWVDGGTGNAILPSFTPADGSIIIRLITDDLTGRNLCWPRPGFLTYENVDRTTLTDSVEALRSGRISYVTAGTVLAHAALVTPSNFVTQPSPPSPFYGFVLKMWKTNGDPLIYPHVYLHQLRLLNSAIPAHNKVYDTLPFGISDSVGSANGAAQAPANDPHDVYLVHRRLLDLGFKTSPFPEPNRWKTALCAHKSGCTAAHEAGGGAHGAGHWAYNKHPPDFRDVASYQSSSAVSAGLSSLVLATNASTVADHYVGMYIELTGGTGAGQFRRIDAYVPGTRTITVATAWSVSPAAGTTYSIVDFSEGGAVIDTIKLVECLLLCWRSDPVVAGVGRIEVTKTGATVTRRSFTERWLWADEAPQWVELSDGPGHHNSEGRPGDVNHHNLDFHYATNYTNEAVRAAALKYYQSYQRPYPTKALIDTNDASYRGGGITCEHHGHATGLDVDIRLPRTSASGGFMTGGVKFNETGYDRRTAFWICRSFMLDQVPQLYFNDPQIYLGGAGQEYHKGVAVNADGVAPAGGDGTTIGWIELSAGASSTPDEYSGMSIEITAGAAMGEKRTIAGYHGGSRTATVDVPWLPNARPDQTSSYSVFAKVPRVSLQVGHDDHIHVNVNPPSVTFVSEHHTVVTRLSPRTWPSLPNQPNLDPLSVFDGLK
ncbi:hypothetical protein [Bradyrhizobium sp.]